MQEKIEKTIKAINYEIEKSKNHFNTYKKCDELTNRKIDGMIQVLNIFTGKEFFYDENGIHEI